MTLEELITKCISDYRSKLHKYQNMFDYYRGQTDAIKKYKMITDRANNKISCNFIKKFIKEETSYILGNKITYISKSGNEDIIKAIQDNTAHWSEKHNQNLCKNVLIYGKAYELYYVDSEGLFSARILTPLNSYALLDDFGNVQLFLHFFKLQFDDTQYLDVYHDSVIEHYKVSGDDSITLMGQNTHIFGQVPVSCCTIAQEEEYDTLWNDIKGLQDAYETNLSDISNEITDFRNAYLKIIGASVESEDLKEMKRLGIMQVPKDGEVEWLIKNINDSFIQNTLTTLEDKMYQLSCHINANEKLVSNTSSLALRTRLIALENKCKLNADSITDCIKVRLKFLFKYLKIKSNKNYHFRDIKCKYTPMIPSDDVVMAQIISQLNGKLSTETGLAQLSFVDNVQEELKKLKAEQEANSIGSSLLEQSGGGLNE